MQARSDRSRWPYPALLPYSLKAYPIVQTAPEIGPQKPSLWPPPMTPSLLAWRERTSLHRPTNQIYLHVPFCPFLCHFCPLYKVKDNALRTKESKQRFVEALLQEIALYGDNPVAAGQLYDSVYFGGGTPTELTPAQLGSILNALRRNFRLAPGAEITLEGVARQMLAPDYLAACLEAGFNRISFGVQSLNVSLRQRIGRGDGTDDYPATVERVKQLNPRASVNAEIMAGLPEQTFTSFEEDVRTLTSWNVDSLDILYYVLMPGTRLEQFVNDGKRRAPEYGASMLAMRAFVNSTLEASGFRQVTGEVFSRSDRDLFVDTSYGGGGNCLNTLLALGPSGFGILGGAVYHNVADLNLYVSQVKDGLYPIRAGVPLTAEDARRRAWAFSLMKLHVPEFLIETSADRKRVQRWESLGLCQRSESGYQLTSRGRLWYNHMQMEVLPLREQLQASRMFGSSTQQSQLFDRSTKENSLEYELLQTISSGTGVLGGLRKQAYRMLLALRRARRDKESAIDFTGSPVKPKA